METLRNLIGGEWRAARSGASAPTLNPADLRETIATHPLSSAEDAGDAVAAAGAAREAFRALPAPRRGRALARAAATMIEAVEPLARALTLDEGKTLEESRSEIRRAAEAFEFCAGETRRLSGETLPSETPNRLVMTLREPHGVAALITPWNYPAQIAAWKLGPALAMGNTAVLKPSSLAPVISARVVEILHLALAAEGAPAGTVNLVFGAGAEAGRALASHPGVDCVSFTGSSAAGEDLRSRVSPRGIPVLCEMGGKNPLIVLEDADLELAAAACVRGAFGNAGQRCTATSRAIVHRKAADRFTELLLARTQSLSVRSGLEAGADVGPLVSRESADAIDRAVSAAIAAGAKRLCGGEKLREGALGHGAFYAPTILAGASPSSPIAQEEVFGPVVVLLIAESDAHALDLANGVRYGLSASVYTRDLSRAMRFVRGIDSGIVHVNSATVGGETHVPFGGMKSTGSGGRERGGAAIDFFTRWKTVYLDG